MSNDERLCDYKRALGRLMETDWENLSEEDKKFWRKHDDYKDRINGVLNRPDKATEGMAFLILQIIGDADGCHDGCYEECAVSAVVSMLVSKNRELRDKYEKFSHAAWLCRHLLKDLEQ